MSFLSTGYATEQIGHVYGYNRHVRYLHYPSEVKAAKGRFAAFPGAGWPVEIWRPVLKELSRLGYDTYAFETENYLSPVKSQTGFLEIPYRMVEMRELVKKVVTGEDLPTTQPGQQKVILSTHSNSGISAALLLAGMLPTDDHLIDLEQSNEVKNEMGRLVSFFVPFGFSEELSEFINALARRLEERPKLVGVTSLITKVFQHTIQPQSRLYRGVSKAYISLVDSVLPLDMRWKEHMSDPDTLQIYLKQLKKFNVDLGNRRGQDTLNLIREDYISYWKRSSPRSIPVMYIHADADFAVSESALFNMVKEQRRDSQSAPVLLAQLSGTDHLTMLLSQKPAPAIATIIDEALQLQDRRQLTSRDVVVDWARRSTWSLEGANCTNDLTSP